MTTLPDFLLGGGEMGALMRAQDWSRSSLGPPAGWPQSLRTVVRLMLNTGHPMYVWWGPQLACLYNDAYRESIGPERHPGSLGRPAREVWAEIWPIIGPQIDQVMSGRGATWQVDQLVPITRHGRLDEVYWTYSYSPIDEDTAPGGIGGVLVVCTETTQQVQAARQLAIERDRLAQLFEQAPIFMVLLEGPAHTIRIANPAYLQLVGHRPIVGKTIAEALPEAAAQGYVVLLDDVFASGRAYTASAARYEVQPNPGGAVTECFLDFVYQPIKDAQDRVTGIFVVGADVTERTRAFAETRQAEQLFRVERERLRLALSAGQMGAYELDIERDTLWWSPETYDLFGVDRARFTPTREGVIDLLHPDDRPGFAKRRKEAIAEHQPFFDEFRIRRPDGSPIWIGYRGQAEYDDRGRAVRTFGVVMDITERKKAEEVLRKADQDKDDFIATLSHELRNPLAPIRSAIAVLRKLEQGHPKVAWCHDVIGRQAEQMAHLLDDLLDVSRLTRRQLTLRMKRLDLAAAIEQAIETAQPVIEASGHELRVHLPQERLQIEGDVTRLAQVFSNLLINSAKYTPARGLIVVTATRQANDVVVKVNDTGIGIAEEHIATIFEMFGQVESARHRSQGGQGIGLSLARGLVELHGGTIRARSEGIGKGSEFEVRLPLAASRASPIP